MSAGAAFFLSIHHDSIPQAWLDSGREREFSGFAVFVSQKNKWEKESARCAYAIGTGMKSVGERPSLYHATPMKGENRPLVDEALGIHLFDDLFVLRNAQSPAVLLEVGVIVNPIEAKRLMDISLIGRVSKALAGAVRKCVVSER